jgi:hypothetical protein
MQEGIVSTPSQREGRGGNAREVDEAVVVLFDVGLTVEELWQGVSSVHTKTNERRGRSKTDLVELDVDETGGDSGGGGESGNDLAGNCKRDAVSALE